MAGGEAMSPLSIEYFFQRTEGFSWQEKSIAKCPGLDALVVSN